MQTEPMEGIFPTLLSSEHISSTAATMNNSITLPFHHLVGDLLWYEICVLHMPVEGLVKYNVVGHLCTVMLSMSIQQSYLFVLFL